MTTSKKTRPKSKRQDSSAKGAGSATNDDPKTITLSQANRLINSSPYELIKNAVNQDAESQEDSLVVIRKDHLTPEMMHAAQELPKLTKRQMIFVSEIVKRPNNGTRAAIKAGYSKGNARHTAWRLQKDENIQRAIELLSASFWSDAIAEIDERKAMLTAGMRGELYTVKTTRGKVAGKEFWKEERIPVDPLKCLAELNKMTGAHAPAQVQVAQVAMEIDISGQADSRPYPMPEASLPPVTTREEKIAPPPSPGALAEHAVRAVAGNADEHQDDHGTVTARTDDQASDDPIS